MADAVVLAADTTKQLLTLSTAIITVGFAYVKDIAPMVRKRPRLLKAAVVLHLLSCTFGIWTLMALTGVSERPPPQGIYAPAVTLPSMLQIGSFLLGLICMSVVLLGRQARAGPRPSRRARLRQMMRRK